MDPIVEAVASENRDTFLIAKLDTDKNPEATGKYRINSLPTFIVFQSGEVIGRFVGGMPKAQLVKQIREIIDVHEN